MNKKEAIDKLLKLFATEGFAAGEYLLEENGECKHCPVGHLLLFNGFQKNELKEFDKFSEYEIGLFITKDSYYYEDEFAEKIRNSLFSLGFTSEEIEEMQLLNDTKPDSYLYKYLKKLKEAA